MPEDEKLYLNEEMTADINGAFASGSPVIVTYVDAEGQPHMSFRGTTQVYSPEQLAFWVREPQGGLVTSLAERPRLTLLFRGAPGVRRSYILYGQGHVADDEETRRTIFENSPEPEQGKDPERHGKAVIVDLNYVEVYGAGTRTIMRRS